MSGRQNDRAVVSLWRGLPSGGGWSVELLSVGDEFIASSNECPCLDAGLAAPGLPDAARSLLSISLADVLRGAEFP